MLSCLLFIVISLIILGVISLYPIVSLSIIIVLIVLGFIADFYIKKEKKEHLDKMETLINNNEKIAWKNFFEIDMTDLIKAEQLIKLGIGKRLFYGEIEKKVSQPFMEILKNETLLFIDELAVNQNFSDYSIVDVKRSTVFLMNCL